MLKRMLLTLLISAVGFSGLGTAQNYTTITIGEAVVPPCEENRVDIPVYLNNPDTSIGAFGLDIILTDPSWFSFDPDDSMTVDTIGARYTNYDIFDVTVHPYGHRVSILAIAYPDSLPPGDGLVFTVHGDFDDKLVSDTCQLINYGSAEVLDILANPVPFSVIRDSLCIEPCDTNLVRGDANQNGVLNGLDVVYLTNYFKGGPSVCLGCPCLADANTSGNVNGLDVVFLVNYFKGGPAPYPPNCTE